METSTDLLKQCAPKGKSRNHAMKQHSRVAHFPWNHWPQQILDSARLYKTQLLHKGWRFINANLIIVIQSYHLQVLQEISPPQNHAFHKESLLQGLALAHHLFYTQDYHVMDATSSQQYQRKSRQLHIRHLQAGKLQYISIFSPSHHAIWYPL